MQVYRDVKAQVYFAALGQVFFALGTVETIGGDGRLQIMVAGGRAVYLDPHRQIHLGYGYAVTSHSSQGQTVDRVLTHLDTDLGATDLLNSRMDYVAASRGAHDAQIFTYDAVTLGHELSRDVSHSLAIQQARPPTLSSNPSSSAPPTSTRSVRDLVWVCNPDPSKHFPDSSSVASEPRLIVPIIRECHG